MATLKMYTNDGNHIWLPNVRRVEQMFYFEATLPADESLFPWDIFQREFAKLKDSKTNLHGIIQGRVIDHANHSALTSVTDKQMLVLYVVTDISDTVRAQNWIVRPGSNFLLENGKTIDRI